MTKQPMKAVTFDAGGTLIHLTEPVGVSYAAVAEEFGIRADPGKLDSTFREAWRTTPPCYSRGTSPAETEKTWWGNFVYKVFEHALGDDSADFPSPGDFARFFDRLYGYFAEPGVWELDPDALPILDRLGKSGIKTGIISNFDERLRKILKNLEVLETFDAVVISNDIGWAKPDRRIFDHAVSELKVPASQILHVGDDPVCDEKGALEAGMNAFLVGKNQDRLIRLIDKLPLALT